MKKIVLVILSIILVTPLFDMSGLFARKCFNKKG